jgi:addiction module HigA family antidote
MAKKQSVPAPGTILKEKYMDEYQISVAQLAKDIGLSASAVRQLINNKLRVSIVIALRLAKYFGVPVQEWIDLQTQYELSELDKDKALTDSIKAIPKAKKAPAPAKGKAPAAAAAKKPGGRRGAGKAAKAADDQTPAAKKPRAPRGSKKAESKPEVE